MREELIRIKHFSFIDYMRITGFQCVGKHSTYQVTGHINGDQEQEYLGMLLGDVWSSIEAVTYDGTCKKIFTGLVTDVDIRKTGGVCLMKLTLVSGTYLMDRQPHLRSFQDENITYRQMLSELSEEYKDRRFAMAVGEGETIPGLIVQYQETDWEFGKRLASHFGADLYPDSTHEGIKFSFGIPEKAIADDFEANEYHSVRRTDKTTGYIVTSREIYYLGDWVVMNGMMLYVTEIKTQLRGSELYHTYFLVRSGSNQIEKKYNFDRIGASLKGNVTAVSKEKVQLILDEDENAAKAGKRWFTYATPYSSPDGTGWYCMPEIGDKVRLVIPCEEEGKSYVQSAVHLESSNGSERVNPDFKSIMNKQGKEILFTPNSLIMTNNAGMSIELLDGEGVKIISNKSIRIQAQDAIEITSTGAKAEIYAKENIILKQGNTQLDMAGSMVVSGARMKLN